ncbi:hypothetical protein [Paractinoplanes toevensis]|uniref:hypothetical protein n=1 Tax=Paractinoplanes toevensis TaxID=571911 RepID=UPI001BB44859|nr:hypothetical protein [Actinoplanes toevensis]
MKSVVDGAGALLLWSGALFWFAWLFTLCLAVMAGVPIGRRMQVRDDEDARAEVRRAVEEAAKPSVALLLPTQRDGER